MKKCIVFILFKLILFFAVFLIFILFCHQVARLIHLVFRQTRELNSRPMTMTQTVSPQCSPLDQGASPLDLFSYTNGQKINHRDSTEDGSAVMSSSENRSVNDLGSKDGKKVSIVFNFFWRKMITSEFVFWW